MSRLPTLSDVKAEAASRSLAGFYRWAWPLINSESFSDGFHIDLICERLEAVARREIKRLLINVPPRHSKSTIVSVAWPAWLWIHHPELRWLFASYSDGVPERDSIACRALIQSPEYQRYWGKRYALTADQNTKLRFHNNRHGARLATSVGGSATGEGGDIIVIDDPHKIELGHSEAHRTSTINWFQQTMTTRLNDPQTGAIVVVGQRLHENDLFGFLLEQGGWDHLCLPAEYEPEHPFCCCDDPRTEPGELLWRNRFTRDVVDRQKRELGAYGAAGQLQQRPSPAGGGLFKREWFAYYDPAELPDNLDDVIQSWDLSFTASTSSDYVAGQVWGRRGPNKYLLHQIHGRLSFTEQLAAIDEQRAWIETRYPRFAGPTLLIEQSANGAAAIDSLRQRYHSVIAVIPTGSKETRAALVSPEFSGHNIWLKGHPSNDGKSYDPARTPPWVKTYIHELESFPNGAHDDQVDATTQAIGWLSKPGPNLRVLGPRR